MKHFYVLATLVLLPSLPFASRQPAVATNVSVNAVPPPVVVRLSASPAKYRGHCPATITFNGEISAPPPVQAGPAGTYKFVRSDGHQSGARTFKAGVSNPSTTWRVGGRSTHKFSGWVQIDVFTSIGVTSSRAEFTVECH